MTLEDLLQRVLREPTPDHLWSLHPVLLALDIPASVRDLARMFYCYLSSVRSKLTSKQYSSLAAALAAGSVGVIALQDLLVAFARDRDRAVQRLLTGGLAETLEMLSTAQHVKAWETEFASVHDQAVWYLYEALWQLSAETQPDLPAGQRQALIDSLLSSVRDPDVNSAVRMALIIRLYQVLLAIRLVPLLAADAPAPAEGSQA